jgi:hypothetical protein
MISETKRKRLTLPPRQFELSAETVSQAASLLRNPTYPSQHILDFIWLLSTKATLAANVDGFVRALHHWKYVVDSKAVRAWSEAIRDVSLRT